MSCDMAVQVTNLSKSYRLYRQPFDRLHQWLFGRWRQYYCQFWAVRDLSFEIARGEVIGILGRNGSGKSTLLQIICGCVAPSSGSITTQGRIAALLELGTGFNPEFSGLENVYLNACILGLNHDEIEKRLDDILAFADIGDFIHYPIKSYSSGMVVRLAFAVAAAVEPDILIIDEALAVGDIQFQSKCFRNFNRWVERGTTIIFVTHSTEQVVRHCSRALLLEGGQLIEDGQPRVVVNHYLERAAGQKTPIIEPKLTGDQPTVALDLPQADYRMKQLLAIPFEKRTGYNSTEHRWGNRLATIRAFHLTKAGSEDHQTHFLTGDRLLATLLVDFLQATQHPIFGLTIKTPDGVTVYGSNSHDCQQSVATIPKPAGSSVIVTFELALWLTQGDYLLSFEVVTSEYGEIIPLDRRWDAVHIELSNPHRSSGLAELRMSYSELLVETAPRIINQGQQ